MDVVWHGEVDGFLVGLEAHVVDDAHIDPVVDAGLEAQAIQRSLVALLIANRDFFLLALAAISRFIKLKIESVQLFFTRAEYHQESNFREFDLILCRQ